VPPATKQAYRFLTSASVSSAADCCALIQNNRTQEIGIEVIQRENTS